MSEIIKEHFKDTSLNLARALHYNKVSLEFFELLKIGSKGETKMLFQNCIQRLNWVYHSIYDRLSANSREILKKEMEDSVLLCEVVTELVKLDTPNRELVESIIRSLAKGETIEFVQNQNY